MKQYCGRIEKALFLNLSQFTQIDLFSYIRRFACDRLLNYSESFSSISHRNRSNNNRKMTLDTTDIIIIVVAVVITVLLTLCLVNLCYYLWLKRNKSFTGKYSFTRSYCITFVMNYQRKKS